MLDYHIPIRIGSANIHPGELLFGDDEGVSVIPRPLEEDAIGLALEKASAENVVAKAIREGLSMQETFETFDVM